MSAIRAIALNTFKEAIRNKILYSLVFFTFLLMAVSLVLDEATIGQRNKIIQDLGLGSINFFGVMIAIVVGINLVYKELEKRTIYALLAKPVRRDQFLIGKYLGIMMTLAVETLLMTAFFFLLVFVYAGSVEAYLILAIFMIYIELAVISATALFFSSFSSPFLSGMFAFSTFVIGHLTGHMKAFGERSAHAGMKALMTFLYYLLPNLERFNLKTAAVYDLPVEGAQIALSLAYGLLYVAVLLLLAVLCFERRDFK